MSQGSAYGLQDDLSTNHSTTYEHCYHLSVPDLIQLAGVIRYYESSQLGFEKAPRAQEARQIRQLHHDTMYLICTAVEMASVTSLKDLDDINNPSLSACYLLGVSSRHCCVLVV